MINIINCYILSRNPPLPLQQILTVHINKTTLLYSAAVQTEQQRRGGEKERKGEMKVAQKVYIILALVGMTLIGDSKGISCKFIIQAHASIYLLSYYRWYQNQWKY